MTDKNKKGSGFPGVGADDEMVDEFAEWDKNLDSLFSDDEPTAASGSGGNAVVQALSSGRDPFALGQESDLQGDEFESSLDFLEDNDSFDDLFTGDPPPLQPPEEEETTADPVITSAARHAKESAGGGNLFENIDDGDDGLIGEVTRILDIDDDLLAASIPEEKPSPLFSPAPTPKVRRTPSIVRRDDLERMRAQRALEPAAFTPDEDEGGDFGFGPEATRITDAEQLESLMSSSANPSLADDIDDGDDEPEISIALDEEFYADIEIDESADHTSSVEKSSGQRRVSTHLLRRDVPKRPTPSPVIAPMSGVVSSDSPAVISGRGQISGEVTPNFNNSIDDAFASLAREVDPEMTLDLRVDELGIPEDEDERANFGLDVLGDPGSSGFDDQADTGVREPNAGLDIHSVQTRPSKPVVPSPATRPSHAFLDLSPSAITSEGLQPVKRPTVAPGGTLERLSGPLSPPPSLSSSSSSSGAPAAPAGAPADPSERAATDVQGEGRDDFEVDPLADMASELKAELASDSAVDPRASAPTLAAIPSQSSSAERDDDNTPVPSEAPTEVAAASSSGVPAPVPKEQDATPIPDGDSPSAATQAVTDTGARRAAIARAETAQPIAAEGPDPVGAESAADRAATDRAAPAELLVEATEAGGDMRAPNSTYDFGLPAVVAGATGAAAPAPAGGRDDAPTGLQPAVVSEGVMTTEPMTPVKGAGRTPGRVPAGAPARAGRTPTAAELAAGQARGSVALPPATLPEELPTLDLGSIAIAGDIGPETVDLEGETAELVAELALYEREVERDEFAPAVKHIRLQAGRIAERLGDVERARFHYEEALGHDPQLAPALRALRRLERSTGDWSAAINYLDTELELASDAEKPGLIAHKADIFMSVGEQDLARVVIGERLDEAPEDVRALLANLELAYVDDRDDEFDATLEQLATTLKAPQLVSCMHMLRGRLSERPVGQPSGDLAAAIKAYQAAASAGSSTALISVALAAQQMGDLETAIAAIDGLSGSELERRDPAYASALHWRRSCWAGLMGDRQGEREALAAAATLGAPEPVVLAGLARRAQSAGDTIAAAVILAQLAESADSPAEKASALVAQAECESQLDRTEEAVAALRAAAELDPADPRATGALERVLRERGDLDQLVALDLQAAEADPAGAIFERVRAAQRQAAAGRHDEAIADLEAGLAAAPESPALSDALLETLALAGYADRRLELLQRLAEDGGELRDAEATLRQLARAADEHAGLLAAEHEQVRAGVLADADASDDQHKGQQEAQQAVLPQLQERVTRAVTQAIDAWNRVLETDSESADAYAAIARLSARLGDRDLLDGALARAQSVASDATHAVSLALARATLTLWDDAPDFSGAEDLAREAMELAPSDPRPPQLLLELAMRDDRALDAAMLLEERATVVDDAQRVASLRYRSAVLLLDRADEPAQAAELLRTVVEEQPQFASARNLLIAAFKRLDEPIDELVEDDDERAGASQSTDFSALIRRAEAALYRTGDAERAVELFSAARELRPDDALARHGLVSAATAAAHLDVLVELARTDAERATQALERAGDGPEAAWARVDAYEAYEEVARVASEVQHDPAASLTALGTAVELAPERVWLLRELDKAYAAKGDWQALYELRGRQLATAENPSERIAWHASRARLARLRGAPEPELLSEYRAAYEIDAQWSLGLFHLERAAREAGPSEELARLEGDIARFFAKDERARAAFATRGAETCAEIGATDEALARFRAASELCGGFAPALFGWRQVALAAENWRELADAALRAAEISALRSAPASSEPEAQAESQAGGAESGAAPVDADAIAEGERIAVGFIHLAGVALMDKAGESDSDALSAAAAAFERVLQLDPGHNDAFARLHTLYQREQRHEDLAGLLERRLAVASEPEKLAGLHRALADLMRTSSADNELARQHLRSVLELVPNEPGAVEALAELAWAEEAWDDAADALILRARLVTDPAEQRDTFFRLGTIYADHKPEPEWAIKSFKRVLAIEPNHAGALAYLVRLGTETKDWPLALQTSERLVDLEDDVEAKLVHLHRIGKIYNEGLKDRPRAERAYRRALDLAPRNSAALASLIDFFEEGRDTRAMRVHLDRVLAPVRNQLVATPTDGTLYRVITQALAARERAGAPGSRAGARCAAELARMVGESGDLVAQLAAEAATEQPPIAGLLGPELDELLFPAVVSNGVRQIFSLIGDRVAKHVGIDLRRYGVGRADRLKRPDAPIARIATAMANKLEVAPPSIYVSSKEKRLLVVEPTNPISLVVSADVLESADDKQLVFAVGRAFKLAQSAFAVPARMSGDEFGVLMVALLRQFAPEFGTLAVDADAVLTQQQRLRRLIPNSITLQLRPFAIGIAGPDFDHHKLHVGIREAGNRAGLLACGSMDSALALMAKLGGHVDARAAMTDAEVGALIRFAVSEDHATLRGQLAER